MRPPKRFKLPFMIAMTIGLALYLLALVPFFLVAGIAFVGNLIMGRRAESWYARLIYTHPVFYELNSMLCNYPLWEDTFRVLPKLRGVTLQIACGTGLGARLIETPENLVINLDMNKNFLFFGHRRGRLKHAVVGDGTRLPFPGNSFDSILIPVAMHHILNHEGLFQECSRVLKEDGKLFIFEPVSYRPRRFRLWNTFHDGPIWIYDRESIRKELTSLSEANGLRIVDLRFFRERTGQNFNGFYNMLDAVVTIERVSPKSKVLIEEV